MTMLDPRSVLSVWERGASQRPAARALLMLSAFAPDTATDTLAGMSIGHRDSQLLSLRERMFGQTVECLSRCPQCAEAIELSFVLGDVRIAHAEPGASFLIEIDGHDFRIRVPDSNDLLALNGQSGTAAARKLLSRCVIEARSPQGSLEPDALSDECARIIEDRLGDLDPQADVRLDLVCPGCGQATQAAFEIENHLWAEIDSWSRALLRDVHALASVYGWSESDILSMSEERRRAYLDLLGS